MSECAYRLVAVPDVITPDGEVRHWTTYQVILRDRLRAAWEEARVLAEAAGEGDEPLTTAEVVRFDELLMIISRLVQRISRL